MSVIQVGIVDRSGKVVGRPPSIKGMSAGGGVSAGGTGVTFKATAGRWFNFTRLHNKTVQTTLSMLQDHAAKLGSDPTPGRRTSTRGNTGFICQSLLQYAKQNPQGIWQVKTISGPLGGTSKRVSASARDQ